jgi:serine/threonine protein kinase
VYALGLIFYELLTGRVPEGVFELPSRITGCPQQVDQILRRCLQADPAQRYSNAAQIDDALSRCDPGAPVLIARSNRRALWTATAVLAALLCGLAAWIVQKVPEKIVNLLAEQRSMHVQGGSASREPDGTLSLQMGHPLRIQLGIDPTELPGAPAISR